MNDNVHPCPCGKEVTVADIGGDYFIFCECGIEFSPEGITNRQELIVAWNKVVSNA